MSWSIEEHIGENRPWPAQVVVYRGETDECLTYVSGEVADRLKAENAKLREELEDQEGYDQMLRDRLRQQTELCVKTKAENAKLRELLLDCWDFSHLMHEAMAARFYELGLIDDGEARELGVEVDG